MNNKSLSYLGIGLFLLILLMGALSVYGYFASTNINKNTESELFDQEDYFKIHGGIYHLVSKRSQTMYEMFNTTDVGKIDELKSNIKNQKEKLISYQRQCIHPHSMPKPNRFTRQGQALAEFSKLEESFLNLTEENKNESYSFFIEKILPQKTKVLAIVQEGIDHIRNDTKKLNQQYFHTNKNSIQTNLLINLLVLLGSFLLFYLLFRSHTSSNNKIYQQARTDSLTGLSNREVFLESTKIHISHHPGSTFLIAFLDIDFFKAINDTYGHKIGDTVLINFSQRIIEIVGKDCLFSRFGGDEFALLIKGTEEKQIKDTIKKLSNSLHYTLETKSNNIAISSSIGASQYPQDGETVEELLNSADQAMYLAKEAGRNTFRFYSKEIRENERINDENTQKLRAILIAENPNNNLYIEYQPLLNCSESPDELKECEALLRWKDENGNNIPPDIFIPLSEKTNLINCVNKFVIDEVCKQQKVWQEQTNLEDIRVNINLSGSKETFKELLDILKLNIKELDLNPKLFGIEITERTLFDISDSTIAELKTIRNMGMKISIDDFGTGYSSFSYLNRLPITTLKIDKTFIDELSENRYNQKIVDSIIALGHSLGLDIVAEGVETTEQLKYLKDKSCNSIQGYLFKRPLPISEIDTYLFRAT